MQPTGTTTSKTRTAAVEETATHGITLMPGAVIRCNSAAAAMQLAELLGPRFAMRGARAPEQVVIKWALPIDVATVGEARRIRVARA